MTGYRVGWVAGDERIIEKFKQKSTIKELKGEIDSQIQEELDET